VSVRALRRESASRRDVLRGVAALTLTPLVGFGAEGISIAPVTPDIKVLTGAGGNIVVLATADGQVLVDSGTAAERDAILATLRELGRADGKVAALFNSHWHLEQTGANDALGRSGATIIAHEKTRQRLTVGW
jgi:glyoxylase-like metal-dependent hydrolase (beta-lactamase superfamily II)